MFFFVCFTINIAIFFQKLACFSALVQEYNNTSDNNEPNYS